MRRWNIENLWEKACLKYPKNPEFVFDIPEKSWFTHINSLEEIILGDTSVFTDDYGSYPGLKDNYLLTGEKPLYVFDNHNKALMAFAELKEQTKEPLIVVHIDAHPDDAKYEQEEAGEITQDNILEYYEASRISDFLDCAERGGLIHTPLRITTEQGFNEKPVLPATPYVLSLDIDIFGPEGAFTSLESKLETLAFYIHHAAALTVATSPGFIDQEEALELVKIFLGE